MFHFTTDRLLCCLIFVLASLMLPAQSCPLEGPFNNPGFYNTYGGATFAAVPDAAGLCGDAIRIQPVAAGGRFNAGFQTLQNNQVIDRANTRYEIEFRYRAASPRDFQFVLVSREFNVFSGGDQYLAPILSATTDYQTFRMEFNSVRSVADASRFRLYFLLAVGDGGPEIFLDNIIMRENVVPTRAPTTLYVSPTGIDVSGGTSAATAFRTIGYGITQMIAGDTLLLADGLYRENDLDLADLNATAANPTTIRSINRWGARIESTSGFSSVLEITSCNYVVIDGLEVFNNRSGTGQNDPDVDWVAGIQARLSNHVTIRNCYAHDCGCNGLVARDGDYITIERNVARDNAKTNPFNCSGITIFQPIAADLAPGPHIIVRQNVVFENECRLPFSPAGFTVPTDGNGIILDDFNATQNSGTPYTMETLVENNLAFNNGGAGIKTFESGNAIIRNNTTYHNNFVLKDFASFTGEIGLQAVSGTVEVSNNIAVNPQGQSSYALSYESFGVSGAVNSNSNLLVGRVNHQGGTFGQTMDNVVNEAQQSFPAFAGASTDPNISFTSVDDFAARFALTPGSPAVDAGNASLAAAVDLLGQPRPLGGDVDQGAFELLPATLPAELLNFSGHASGKQIHLAWSTGVEDGVAEFLVQRSGDGLHFTTIATVAARGGLSSYTSVDSEPLDRAYYRLLIRDHDGSEEYGTTLLLSIDISGQLSVYPNPSTGSFTVVPPANYRARAGSLVLTDLRGREVLRRAVGANTETGWTWATDLPRGVYVLRLRGETTSTLVHRIVIR